MEVGKVYIFFPTSETYLPKQGPEFTKNIDEALSFNNETKGFMDAFKFMALFDSVSMIPEQFRLIDKDGNEFLKESVKDLFEIAKDFQKNEDGMELLFLSNFDENDYDDVDYDDADFLEDDDDDDIEDDRHLDEEIVPSFSMEGGYDRSADTKENELEQKAQDAEDILNKKNSRSNPI